MWTRLNQQKHQILWETTGFALRKSGVWKGFDEETLELEETFTKNGNVDCCTLSTRSVRVVLMILERNGRRPYKQWCICWVCFQSYNTDVLFSSGSLMKNVNDEKRTEMVYQRIYHGFCSPFNGIPRYKYHFWHVPRIFFRGRLTYGSMKLDFLNAAPQGTFRQPCLDGRLRQLDPGSHALRCAGLPASRGLATNEATPGFSRCGV